MNHRSFSTAPSLAGKPALRSMKKDYSKLDSLIIAAIASGKNQFSKIFSDEVRAEARPFASDAGYSANSRVVDRRLQAIRQQGQIRFHNGGWALCKRDASSASNGGAEPSTGGQRTFLSNQSFQERASRWVMECFGAIVALDPVERNFRFGEEALELLQSCGATASQCHQLVDYVFSREVGEKHQELGGVMVTLAALATANGLTISEAAEKELARVWTKISQIKAKQAAKPKSIARCGSAA